MAPSPFLVDSSLSVLQLLLGKPRDGSLPKRGSGIEDVKRDARWRGCHPAMGIWRGKLRLPVLLNPMGLE